MLHVARFEVFCPAGLSLGSLDHVLSSRTLPGGGCDLIISLAHLMPRMYMKASTFSSAVAEGLEVNAGESVTTFEANGFSWMSPILISPDLRKSRNFRLCGSSFRFRNYVCLMSSSSGNKGAVGRGFSAEQILPLAPMSSPGISSSPHVVRCLSFRPFPNRLRLVCPVERNHSFSGGLPLVVI